MLTQLERIIVDWLDKLALGLRQFSCPHDWKEVKYRRDSRIHIKYVCQKHDCGKVIEW